MTRPWTEGERFPISLRLLYQQVIKQSQPRPASTPAAASAPRTRFLFLSVRLSLLLEWGFEPKSSPSSHELHHSDSHYKNPGVHVQGRWMPLRHTECSIRKHDLREPLKWDKIQHISKTFASPPRWSRVLTGARIARRRRYENSVIIITLKLHTLFTGTGVPLSSFLTQRVSVLVRFLRAGSHIKFG